MMLPFSSATSRTQSVLPVAIIKCVLQPFTWPYSSSVSSIVNFRGYLTSQLAQSCKHSSPSTSGVVFGNNASLVGALVNSPGFLFMVGTLKEEFLGVSLYARFFRVAVIL
jgi:hypothetical protein